MRALKLGLGFAIPHLKPSNIEPAPPLDPTPELLDKDAWAISGTGFTVENGVASHVGETGFLRQPVQCKANKRYLHTFRITSRSIGGFVHYVAGPQGTTKTALGTYNFEYQHGPADGTVQVGLQTSINCTATADNISFREIVT